MLPKKPNKSASASSEKTADAAPNSRGKLIGSIELWALPSGEYQLTTVNRGRAIHMQTSMRVRITERLMRATEDLQSDLAHASVVLK